MIPIIYEDNHVIVVEKPVNIPVQEDATGDKDMLTLLKEDIKVRYQKPGNVYLGLVHRLDRPVGGVMVFAKTSKAASRLSDAMRRQAFDKKYLAAVRGKPQKDAGRLEHYLWKDKNKNQVYVKPKGKEGAKKALLEYNVIASHRELALINVALYTGRSHQIRVQLSEIGCPIYGDQKYGSSVNKPGEQIALWAHELSFEHPVKKEMMSFKANPPKEYPWDAFNIIQQHEY
ncbi:23S rRNA pseudouridine1911/1915/1917 synthase [Alkalicoccus daliensis]|uniref:RNA pseudouridylate synthase n=1 Tax=Alkalicoccus daliensis TaxID=745820 RepID=A0A1H0KNR3_9BACI|nr:23S rRNA pseudouridine1911/1915/1917 synthase [Alkalicoccus daliensis]